jgi:CRISPR-associated endonuclease Csy4
MNFYIEITLLPGVDVGLYFLWEKVFQQIHKGLVRMKDSNGKFHVGLSFPEYDSKKYQLGAKVRLFAYDEKILDELNLKKLLSGYLDYVHLTRSRSVPNSILSYAKYKRQQPKSSIERLARRKAKREAIPEEKALKFLQPFQEQRVETPYINMRSISSGHRFRLFVHKQESQFSVNGEFSCYGLSGNSTVPEF